MMNTQSFLSHHAVVLLHKKATTKKHEDIKRLMMQQKGFTGLFACSCLLIA
jgi:hypothetical protein